MTSSVHAKTGFAPVDHAVADDGVVGTLIVVFGGREQRVAATGQRVDSSGRADGLLGPRVDVDVGRASRDLETTRARKP